MEHKDCLDSEGIQRLVCPARSPDLKPIENVWDALGRQVAGRNYPPTNKNTLIHALREEWDKLHQQLLDNVVQSMSLDCGQDHKKGAQNPEPDPPIGVYKDPVHVGSLGHQQLGITSDHGESVTRK
ncbi:hypothetical protein TNCV_582881 [Trichonephila clavipes]|nr:hypothetical protein TNCV_582881 [Trichonephila clavipes]